MNPLGLSLSQNKGNKKPNILLLGFILSITGCRSIQLAPHPIPVFFPNESPQTQTTQQTQNTQHPEPTAKPSKKHAKKEANQKTNQQSKKEQDKPFFILEDWF